MRRYLALFSLALILAGCGSSGAPPQAAVPVPTDQPPATHTPGPTQTPVIIVVTATPQPATPTSQAPTPTTDTTAPYLAAVRSHGSAGFASMYDLSIGLQDMDIADPDWRVSSRTQAQAVLDAFSSIALLTPPISQSHDHHALMQLLQPCRTTVQIYLTSLDAAEADDLALGLERLKSIGDGFGTCGTNLGEAATMYSWEIPAALSGAVLPPTDELASEFEPGPTPMAEAAALTATVTNGGNVRTLPSVDGSTVLEQVNAYETVLLRNQSTDGKWYSIVTPRGVIGWVSASLLTVVPSAVRAVPVSDVDEAVVAGTSPIPDAPIEPTEVAETAPQDDEAYGEYLQSKFEMLGDRKLTFTDFTINRFKADGDQYTSVDFEIDGDDIDYMIEEDTNAAREAWATALLAELKSHWPGQIVFGSLTWTYWGTNISTDTDCSHMGDYLSDDGWSHTTYFARVQINPEYGSSIDCT